MLHQIYQFLTTGPGVNAVLAIPPLLLAGIIAAASALAGAANNKINTNPAEEKERQFQATTARWSPWTKLASHSVQNTPTAQAALSAGNQGFAFGQSIGGMMGSGKNPNGAASETPQSGSTYAFGGNPSVTQGQSDYFGMRPVGGFQPRSY